MINLKRPWQYKYEPQGGYDCMSDAIYIYADGEQSYNYIFKLDLRDFGQENCEPPSKEVLEQAMGVAQEIIACMNLHSP